MTDTDNIDELYNWINGRYEQYTNGEITEEEYLADLEKYKAKLAEIEPSEDEDRISAESKASINPSKVRSTSIAGLRKKLLDEMKK